MTSSPPSSSAQDLAEAGCGLDLIDERPDDAPTLDLDALSARLTAALIALARPRAEVCVVLVDDAAIALLNARWRGVEGPTDVLSFPMQEGEGAAFAGELLGDVVISVERAACHCAAADHHQRVAHDLGVAPAALTWSLLDEVTFLAIHGLLHLVGHDHAEPDEEARMRAEEARLMRPLLAS